MIKQSLRYIALTLTLLAFTTTVHTASAQSSCPTSTSCVVTGTDPEPMGVVEMILLTLLSVPLQ